MPYGFPEIPQGNKFPPYPTEKRVMVTWPFQYNGKWCGGSTAGFD
jgi:hypothetical protein